MVKWMRIINQGGIILLTLATAAIHLYLNVIIGEMDYLFTANALGYLILGSLYFAPVDRIKPYRKLIWILYLLYTLGTITAWFFIGTRVMLAYWTKIIEATLVVMLWLDRPTLR